MTAELGTMMPDMGGPIVWVDRAFGRRVAHSNAIIRLVANFFDLALYPVMFADYLRELHPMLKLEGVHRYLLSASLVGAVTLLNVAGVDAVASVSTVFTVLVISPFAALVIYGLPRVDPLAWLIGLNPAEWSSLGGVGGGESTVGRIAGAPISRCCFGTCRATTRSELWRPRWLTQVETSLAQWGRPSSWSASST